MSYSPLPLPDTLEEFQKDRCCNTCIHRVIDTHGTICSKAYVKGLSAAKVYQKAPSVYYCDEWKESYTGNVPENPPFDLTFYSVKERQLIADGTAMVVMFNDGAFRKVYINKVTTPSGIRKTMMTDDDGVVMKYTISSISHFSPLEKNAKI